MHLTYRNVNDAFHGLVKGIRLGTSVMRGFGDPPLIPTVRKPSRVGDVLMVEEPMTITFTHPKERVLFNQARDANPFFHLYEALWMLAGRNDIAPLDYYSGGYSKFVKDGDSPYANGAYGYRWRNNPYETSKPITEGEFAGKGTIEGAENADQLRILIDHLKANPGSRRAVLQMWNVEDDLLKIDTSKDVCCNTCVYFSIRELWIDDATNQQAALAEVEGHPKRCLDMTVCNRSNDLILGMLGANVVHFSILQEYMARAIGCEVGVYNQFTNNMHVYTENWKPEEWLDSRPEIKELTSSIGGIGFDAEDAEIEEFVERHSKDAFAGRYKSQFLYEIAQPLCIAFHHHKNRKYDEAHAVLNVTPESDWKHAARCWISKRHAAWAEKHGFGKEKV